MDILEDKKIFKDIERLETKTQKKILKKKLDTRLKYNLLTQSDNSKYQENRLLLYEMCENDWKFFVDNFVWIQDPELDEKDIPFLLWDFQERAGDEIVKAIERGYDLPVEKSRKLGITWLVLMILLWGWQFKKWDVLVGSNKFENVDKRGDMGTLFQKVRYAINRLPQWIFPLKLDHYSDKVGLIIHPQHNSRFSGEANNDNFGRSDRSRVIFLDEFASWEQTDRAAWQGSSATTKCRIPVSTPNRRGVNCWFYKIVEDHKKKGKPCLTLEWTLHPEFSDGLRDTTPNDTAFNLNTKYTSPWLESQIKRASDTESVAQEILINYEASMAGKVFGSFDYSSQVSDRVKYDVNLPLYVSWDFGLDQTAILWIQTDGKKFYIIDEYKNKSLDIYHYLDVLDSKGYKSAIHFGDPYSGGNRSVTSGQSPSTILRRHGIVFRCQRARIADRISAARNLLSRVIVSSDCVFAIDMFTSWQMKNPKTGNVSSAVPDHSEHSHIGEAFSYFCFNFNKSMEKKTFVPKKFTPSISGVLN